MKKIFVVWLGEIFLVFGINIVLNFMNFDVVFCMKW